MEQSKVSAPLLATLHVVSPKAQLFQTPWQPTDSLITYLIRYLTDDLRYSTRRPAEQHWLTYSALATQENAGASHSPTP